MAIVVLFEVRSAQDAADGTGTDVTAVHATGPDPDPPGDPLPTTLCG
ncbi:hypothetical protein [Kitasatospora griseola]